MAVKYAAPPEPGEGAPLVPHPTGAVVPSPAPPAHDPMETVMLVVDRCLGHGPKDDKKRRALATWLESRHPEHTAAWWLAQWGLT